MKKQLLFWLLVGVLCLSVSAQKVTKPNLTPKPPTAGQQTLIEEGIALHDAKKYDAAIKKYEEVLAENPDCTLAMYELALTLYAKPDKNRALDVALKGAQYKSDELALFYGMVANIIDDQGNPKAAVRLYQDAIEMLEGERDLERHLSSLHYNLGVTYTRQKLYKEARQELKKAVAYNYRYPSPHYVLAEVFYASRYKVPALLAAARLISLEINSSRSKRSTAIFLDVMKSAKKDEKTNSINIFVDIDAPKDEGEFAMYDLILGTLTIVKNEKGENKTEEENFADAFDTLIAMLAEDKKLPSTFVGKNYIPFFSEMKKKGYSRIFAYLILQQNGNQTAEKWLVEQGQKSLDFINWAKTYELPKK